MTSVPQERKLVTAIPGPKSQELHQRTKGAVSAGVGIGLPVYVERAGGGILVDVDGNQLIDFGSGIAVTSVGNSAPKVVEKAKNQLDDFTHTCFMVTPYEEYTAVCEKLNELTPGDHEKRSALFNSGAEAVENAVKIARVHTGRQAVVAFDHAYHGRTNLTMALTAKNMPYKQGFGPFAGDVYRMPMAYPYRWVGNADTITDDAFEAFTSAVHAQIGEQNVAAVIIEPIQGEGGFIVPPAGWLKKVADWCRENGIVFIADEVQTGFARTGRLFAMEHHGVAADLTTMAKGLGGGLPISAVTGRAEVMDSPAPGGLGGTYAGNPLAVAAAHAVLDVIAEEDLCARATRLGQRLKQRLAGIAHDVPEIVDIRGPGFMNAVEFNIAGSDKPNPEMTNRVREEALGRNLILLTCGVHGNVIRFLAPLTIPEAVFDEALDILEDSIRAARS